MIITNKDLENMKERNCGNCNSNNGELKLPNIGCQTWNKIMNKNDCCPLHTFADWM